MPFKDKLKEARTLSGFTQLMLADRIGVSKQTVTKYETGVREPDLLMLDKLADALGVDVDYLLDRPKKKSAPSAAEADWTRDENQVNVILLSMPLEAKVRAVQFYLASKSAKNALDADAMMSAARLLDEASGESLPKIELSDLADARVGRDVEENQHMRSRDDTREKRSH